MPEIKLKHIVSFSSEDKNNPAENLLKSEGFGKWVCSHPGAKQATVVIQFEKSSKIHQIDIGNAHSAFVEVLVGRSSQASEDDYQVILVASSFMSPLESRNNTNRNRVRIFESDKLSKTATEEKWDRVKIVCSQPFNKNITYGISFIKLHSPPADVAVAAGEAKLGGFKLKPAQDDDISPGSLFANRFKTSTASPLSGAAAARAASRLADEASQKESGREQKTPVKRKLGEEGKTVKSLHPEKTEVVPAKKSTSLSGGTDSVIEPHSSKFSTSHSARQPPKKKQKAEVHSNKDGSIGTDFGKLMKGVVFVLSGFQNPRRGEIRDKALQMGAVYKPDWGKGCTHLVCAFANTPKFHQVKGKGKIVSKDWIEECYRQKKLLSWKKYRMGDDDSTDSEAEVERQSPPRRSVGGMSAKESKAKKRVNSGDGGDSTEPNSGSDTEDDIRKVQEQDKTGESKNLESEQGRNSNNHASGTKDGDDEDPYEVSTDIDDDEDGDENLEIPQLPDFFTGKHFLLYGEFSAEERKQAKRYIIAFNGILEEYMGDKVNYVVTSVDWDEQFDQALSDNSELIFVRPLWLIDCCQQNRLLPYQRYLVVPK